MTHKVGQTDLRFGLTLGFISRSTRLQVSLCAAVTICATLVNIQIQRERERQCLISLYEKLSQTAEQGILHSLESGQLIG